MIYTFADTELDTDSYELRRGGELVPIEPLTFDLLVFLIQHQNELLSRDTLIRTVWKGRLVSDSTISGAIKSSRRAIADDGVLQRHIKTVCGCGFKFVGNTLCNKKSVIKSAENYRDDSSQDKHPGRGNCGCR